MKVPENMEECFPGNDEMESLLNTNGASIELVKKLAKALHKSCEQLNIPMLLVYYTEKEGYTYKGLLPQEFVNNGQLGNNPNRFPELFRVARGFDKEEYKKLVIND